MHTLSWSCWTWNEFKKKASLLMSFVNIWSPHWSSETNLTYGIRLRFWISGYFPPKFFFSFRCMRFERDENLHNVNNHKIGLRTSLWIFSLLFIHRKKSCFWYNCGLIPSYSCIFIEIRWTVTIFEPKMRRVVIQILTGEYSYLMLIQTQP